MSVAKESATPVAQGERVDELDVLRGFALLGVLIANFIGIASEGLMATEAQLSALPTAALDQYVLFFADWLVNDKANTMFATLFGLGFYIQISRNGDRPGFVSRYSRRLFWLEIFGLLNLVLLWVWDILHIYAIGGFILLAARNWKTRSYVICGLLLALFSVDVLEAIAEAGGLELMPWDPYSDASVLARQAASASGNYTQLVDLMWRYNWADWFAGGAFFAWLAYAPGRFMLGAAIGRSGIVDDIAGHLPLLRRIALVVLPLGLALALIIRFVTFGYWEPFGEASKPIILLFESPSALLTAAGYACAIVLAWHRSAGRAVLDWFRPVGQMALTNYLMQGFAYGFVLFGVGPGLALGGRIGTAAVLLICLAFFALQMLLSRWWLARFRFGPMEWLWRWLTYGGAMPAFRR